MVAAAKCPKCESANCVPTLSRPHELTCVPCGNTFNRRAAPLKQYVDLARSLIIVGCLGYVCWLIWPALGSRSSVAEAPAAVQQPARKSLAFNEWHPTKRGGFGCKTKELTDRIFSIMESGDKDAGMRLLLQKVLEDECTTFKVGDQVYLEDFAFWTGLLKVRSKGSTESYFVAKQMIE